MRKSGNPCGSSTITDNLIKFVYTLILASCSQRNCQMPRFADWGKAEVKVRFCSKLVKKAIFL